MTYDDFFAALKNDQVARAYLFHGEEEFVKEKALSALRAKLLPAGLEDLNENILTAPRSDAVIAAAETLPMLADRRLVLVRDCALLTSGKAADESGESERLCGYLDNLPDTVCLVFYCRGNADGRKKLVTALEKKGMAVKFAPLDDAALGKWVRSQFKSQGKKITAEDAAYLTFVCGRELMNLSGEIGKLAAYAGNREEILRSDIDQVATRSLECTVFQLVDALVARKEGEAFRLLDIMLQAGEGRIGILAMLIRQYRLLTYLKLMQADGQSEDAMRSRLGVPSFAFRRLVQQARGMETAAVRQKLDLCVDTDFAIKSGKMREDAALERAMLKLCS